MIVDGHRNRYLVDTDHPTEKEDGTYKYPVLDLYEAERARVTLLELKALGFDLTAGAVGDINNGQEELYKETIGNFKNRYSNYVADTTSTLMSAYDEITSIKSISLDYLDQFNQQKEGGGMWRFVRVNWDTGMVLYHNNYYSSDSDDDSAQWDWGDLYAFVRTVGRYETTKKERINSFLNYCDIENSENIADMMDPRSKIEEIITEHYQSKYDNAMEVVDNFDASPRIAYNEEQEKIGIRINIPATEFYIKALFGEKAYEEMEYIEGENLFTEKFQKYWENDFIVDEIAFTMEDNTLDYNKSSGMVVNASIPSSEYERGMEIGADCIVFNEDLAKVDYLEILDTNMEDFIFDISEVSVYEEIVDDNAIAMIRKHADKLKEIEQKGNQFETVTDSTGHFEFYGLDPAKKYTVKFYYNGMRYEEVNSNLTAADTSGNSIEITSKARENETERTNLINTFKEIGTYPYNYHSNSKRGYNIAYTQSEVQNEINTLNGSKQNLIDIYIRDQNPGIDESKAYFLMDTKITALTEPIGDILKIAEEKVKANNKALDSKAGNAVYPVVVKGNEVSFNTYEEALANAEAEKSGNPDVVGYVATENVQYDLTRLYSIYTLPDYYKVDYNIPFKKDEKIVKTKVVDYKKDVYKLEYDQNLIPAADDYFTVYQPGPKGELLPAGGSYYLLQIEDGYDHDTVRNNIRFGTFISNKEPYFTKNEEVDGKYDKYIVYKGIEIEIIPSSGGFFFNLPKRVSSVKDSEMEILMAASSNADTTETGKIVNQLLEEHVSDSIMSNLTQYIQKNGSSIDLNDAIKRYKEENTLADGKGANAQRISEIIATLRTNWGFGKAPTRKAVDICNDLLSSLEETIAEQGLIHINLGVKYRPTVDLGLIEDVTQAVVTVNGKVETYKYNKRAANGQSFKFGVNDYDIGKESDYTNYYQTLSNGGIPDSNVALKEESELNYLRDYDLDHPRAVVEKDDPENGIANQEVEQKPASIEIEYKIRLVNQSNTDAGVTEVVDWYDSNFTVVGAYLGSENARGNTNIASTTSIYGSRGSKQEVASANGRNFKTIYIPVGNDLLKNGESKYVYVVLRIENPTLANAFWEELHKDGYKTFNYAEINGYRTNIGVIDIDSIPGNIVEDGQGRMPNGKYEDDEGKSPTLIFKNPSGAVREISGKVYEDLSTDTMSINVNTNQERNGGSGTKGIKGATVELYENGKLNKIVYTDAEGNFKFRYLVPGEYFLIYRYGDTEKTALITRNGGANEVSYNGESFENTDVTQVSGEYWYTTAQEGKSYSWDNADRRMTVTGNFRELNNHNLEVLNSWKDTVVDHEGLVKELITNAQMESRSPNMTLEVEFIKRYPDKVVEDAHTRTEDDFEYTINNINFGIVERERAELSLKKYVKEIKIIDSTGKEITGGTVEEIAAGNVKYIKMVRNMDMTINQTTENQYYVKLQNGFAAIEIDNELISGATLKITYGIDITNSSEKFNEMKDVTIVDYVSNNLNYDENDNKDGNKVGWTPVTLSDLKGVNQTSQGNKDIDLTGYQTLLTNNFGTIGIGETKSKELVLVKNLSSEEDSNFLYENSAEIISATNEKGRGDFSSIYGNYSPEKGVSTQGNLTWDEITEQEPTGRYIRLQTAMANDGTTSKAMRIIEKDSGYAEELAITPPTGTKGFVLEPIHYILLISYLLTIAGITVCIKKIRK